MPHSSGDLQKIQNITQSLTSGAFTSVARTVRVFDAPVVVDESTCITGCTICLESCPVDCLAIHPERRKSYMKFDECWYCLACEVDCPTNSITVKIPFLLR
jgi:NAD-dependent dihydropyrimidine dehydrogenase PreA subunit